MEEATYTGYERESAIFRALSHPIRLEILDILARQEACVCHLTAILEQRQPYVSQQLATLREAGLVGARREATLIYYRLASMTLAHLIERGKATVGDLYGKAASFPPQPEQKLAKCPCPKCQESQAVR